MKINKSDALFLYKVLFHYANMQQAAHGDTDRVLELSEDLRRFILESDPEAAGDDADSDSDDNQEELLSEDADFTVNGSDLHDLPEMSAQDESGNTHKIEFELLSDGESASVDLIVDGDIGAEDVEFVRVGESTLTLQTSEGDILKYTFKRLPKRWSSILHSGLHEVVLEEDDSE